MDRASAVAYGPAAPRIAPPPATAKYGPNRSMELGRIEPAERQRRQRERADTVDGARLSAGPCQRATRWCRLPARVCLSAVCQVQRHRDAGDDDVGASLQGDAKHPVKVVVQDAITQLAGEHHRDEHDDLLVVALT